MTAHRLDIAMLSFHSCPVGRLGGKDTGGMNVYIRELSRALGEQGHTVDVYTRAHDPVEQQVVELTGNVRLVHLEAGEVNPITKSAAYSYVDEFARNLERFRCEHRLGYDLVHSNYWMSGEVGSCLAKSWHVPHITMFHTLGAVKNALGIGAREPATRIWAERMLTQDCDRIVCATDKEKEDLQAYYGAAGERIGVVSCGVDVERFTPLDRAAARRHLGLDDRPVVLYVGRIESLKGLDRLIRATAQLDGHRPARVLVVGGDERDRDELQRLARLACELGVEHLVTFEGAVEHSALPLYYNAADVCAIPSYYESFCMVALEALACGTPVVGSRVGCIETLVRDGLNGYKLDDDSPSELAQKLLLALAGLPHDSDGRTRVRGSVQGLAWPVVARGILEQYRQVLPTCAGVA
ncbi:MAG: glycosyltransferase [Chloroflexota bacterium]